MNERIKELLERCQIETYGVNGELLEIGFDAEKFAELIVQKCADIGEQYADGNYEVYNSIVEYFGMQEPEE
jgi:hypothetical protein